MVHILIYIVLLYALPSLIWFQFYKSKSLKRKWIKFLMPILNALFWMGVFLAQIDSIQSKSTFEAKWNLYFHNDGSIVFYFLIIPQIIIGTIAPLVIFGINKAIHFMRGIVATITR
ncbi:hypothetical protein DP73_21265 [Desulfosporosinus sp. HMP52]|nr:hypothetical protein DP73_21265 [Desulfosporosinus sp. HMP52]